MNLLKAAAASAVPMTANDLADICGINRSTAWRLLITLEYHGMLDRDPDTQRYVVGHEILRLAEAGSVSDVVVARARPVLQQLSEEFGETVGLALPTPTGITVVDQSETTGLFGVNLIGVTLPLHASASGKARLAFDASINMDELAGDGLGVFTDQTISDLDDLRAELDRVEKRGYSLERDEFEAGVSGAAAPIFDAAGDLRAVISVWGMSARIGRRKLGTLGSRLRVAADELTNDLTTPARGRPSTTRQSRPGSSRSFE